MLNKNTEELIDKKEEKAYRENEISMGKALAICWSVGIILITLFLLTGFKVIPRYVTLIISAIILIGFFVICIIVKRKS